MPWLIVLKAARQTDCGPAEDPAGICANPVIPMSGNGDDVHCIRKQQWKLRVAQCIKGEIYLNDRTTQAKESAWLAVPELYDLSRDPIESYDIAHLQRP